jgi:hypothetical protein
VRWLQSGVPISHPGHVVQAFDCRNCPVQPSLVAFVEAAAAGGTPCGAPAGRGAPRLTCMTQQLWSRVLYRSVSWGPRPAGRVLSKLQSNLKLLERGDIAQDACD